MAGVRREKRKEGMRRQALHFFLRFIFPQRTSLFPSVHLCDFLFSEDSEH